MAFTYGAYLTSSLPHYIRFSYSGSFGASSSLNDLDLHQYISHNSEFCHVASSQQLINHFSHNALIFNFDEDLMNSTNGLPVRVATFGPFSIKYTESGHMFPIKVSMTANLFGTTATLMTGSISVHLRQENSIPSLNQAGNDISILAQCGKKTLKGDAKATFGFVTSGSCISPNSSILEADPDGLLLPSRISTFDERSTLPGRTISANFNNCFLDIFASPVTGSTTTYLLVYGFTAYQFCPVLNSLSSSLI